MKGGKYPAMSADEMDQMNLEIAANNHLYAGGEAPRSEVVRNIVAAVADDLNVSRERVSLEDTRRVRELVQEYVESCKRVGLLPSKSGTARALGYSRFGLRSFVQSKPEHPTSEYLQMCFDAFAEMLDIAALGGATQAIYSIFVSKSQWDTRENGPVYEPQPSALGPVTSTQELAKKYAELVIE